MRKRTSILAVLAPSAAVMGLAVLGLAFDNYVQYVFCLCMVAVIAAVALVPLVGYAKIVMLAGGAMMGIGAYSSSLLIINFKVPFLLAVAVAGVFGACAGFIAGLPATRFRGHHLAMVTLVFQSLGIIILREWKSVTGGAEGIRVPRASISGYEFKDDASSLLLLGVFAALAVLAMGVVLRGRFGRLLRAITASEVASVAFGIKIGRVKVAVFVLSSMMLAIGGAVLAPQLRIIDPESFGFTQSINAVAYALVGGMSSIWGAFVGGVLLRALPEALRSFAEYSEVAFTALALLIILRLPNGLVGAAADLTARFRPAKHRDETPAAATHPSTPARVAAPEKFWPPFDGPALEATGVRKTYGSLVAVDNVSLRVEQGEIHGVIGPNGAGKTTFFNLVSGLTMPDAGELRLFGQPSAASPADERIRIGVTRTFQHLAVFSQLSCLDNVLIGLGRNGVVESFATCVSDLLERGQSRARQAAAMDALAAVGLQSRAWDRAGALSVGDQRRLEIARAIASRPRLLLLDEPVSGVDPEDEERLMQLLRTLNRGWGLTMLLIEHNIRFVVGCSHTMSVMHEGAVVAHGSPQQVIGMPEVQHIYFGKTT
ncbi:branched-chain amino acid ABC transporter ATP-binding protein/permease [Caenimonas soli]|uniref:branched-chain amino acid ABC transporter ATP-binding protein/permease n=1 Tax=Caenimonas soli TaxID=2735555 RepID=UPI001555C96A|nr:branched-chain amino acid ABC transporter ATP-binding protein/permease [Caenimonas soli]NPC58241.1 branched-chain amino acid ABC transporter ATP-binding protein/permease [Caenimonas soli]